MNTGDIVVLKSTDDEWLRSASLTDTGSIHKLSSINNNFLTVSESALYLQSRCFRLASSTEKEAYDKGIRHIRDIVYLSEFKKDDYIVILAYCNSSTFRTNWCYKQRESLPHLRVYKDSLGLENSTMSVQYSIKPHWRYATADEICRYNAHNSSFDTRESSNYIGRYIKCLKDKAFFTDHKIGDYVLLERNDPGGRYRATIATSPRNWQYPANHEMSSRGWEVMPEGWSLPESSTNTSDVDAILAELRPEVNTTDLTKLPTKWTIKRDSGNYKVINQWFIDNGHGDPSDSSKYIVIRSDSYTCHLSIPPGYVEITFDQFKQWVMRPAIADVKADSAESIRPTNNLEFQESVIMAKSKNKSKLVIIN